MLSDDIRASVLHADRQFQVIDGGKRGGNEPPEESCDDAPCPVTALGHLDGEYYFLDRVGQKRVLSARQVGARHDLMSLFMGDDKWLRNAFPKKAQCKVKTEDGGETTEEKVVDFRINSVAAYLQAECGRAGLFGDHIAIRKPGVWPAENGMPVVHCGDQVLIGDSFVPAGARTGNQVWAAAPPSPRPGKPCGPELGRHLVSEVKRLWKFRTVGGEIATIGLLGCAYYGASIPWRPAGFIIGGAGSGKSSLLNVLASCSPLHAYSNDTTKAGLEQLINGRATPAFIDEASDREDQRGAKELLNLLLASSGGSGTRGVRGGKDGTARAIEVAASIILASIAPPDMQAQHLGRLTIIDLDRPDEGADHSADHAELLAWGKKHGAALWGRALAGWDRYRAAKQSFRDALAAEGCQPREMDQLGAIMAGWWVLTEDGVPDARGGQIGVGALREFMRDTDEIVHRDAPAQMIAHLMSQLVMVQRSTERKSIADLVARVLDADPDNDPTVNPMARSVAREVLAQHGMRVVRADEPKARSGAEAPRGSEHDGLWFSQTNATLKRLFDGTAYQGDKWLYNIRRLESARAPKSKVRIGNTPPARCIWVNALEMGFGEDEMA